MKDEIKEIERILATSGKYITYAERCYVLDYITNLRTIEQQYSALLSENAELENKITNLQEENEKVHKELDYADNYNIYLISKIDKAIEYLREIEMFEKKFGFDGVRRKKLLNILQGEGKE